MKNKKMRDDTQKIRRSKHGRKNYTRTNFDTI